MSKLLNLNQLDESEMLDILTNNELIIFEDVQGSKIYVNYDGKVFNIKPKSLSSDTINMIDLAMQNYYNKALNFFNSKDDRIKGLLSKKWWFCFEYFPDEQPANIEYNKVPKNNLVLTSIYKGNKFDYSIDELDEYARLLDVDVLPVIFKGKLNDKTIETIKYFLNTSEDDLEYVFGESSFTYFFYKLLNPQLTNSFLMDNEFQKNIEKIIIRIDNDKDISFELLNPLYKKISEINNTSFTEVYTLILVNFLNFCQSVNLDNIKIKGNRRDECYIYLISKLFNMYVTEVKDDLLNFDFIVPEFFDKDKFRINIELVRNKLTRDYIEESKKLEYIYKILLGSFNKKKKKVVGIFTERTLDIFNKFIDDLNKLIDEYLNKKSEIELGAHDLVDFSTFFDLKSKIDVDSTGTVYPDVYNNMVNGIPDNSKKKKGKEIYGKDYKFGKGQIGEK